MSVYDKDIEDMKYSIEESIKRVKDITSIGKSLTKETFDIDIMFIRLEMYQLVLTAYFKAVCTVLQNIDNKVLRG